MTDNELNALTNRELGVLVGEKLMGWEPGTLDEYRKQVAEWGEGKTVFDFVGLLTYLPDYANDIAAAWQGAICLAALKAVGVEVEG